MKRCIDHCLGCHRACEETLAHCLEMGGPHSSQTHVTLMQDCADACATSANFLMRGSPRHKLTCRVCADVCEACADDCERIGAGDEVMQACAATCRSCALTCQQMAD